MTGADAPPPPVRAGEAPPPATGADVPSPPVWRHDALRDRWTIQSPARGGRPRGIPDDACPFCPGAESLTPPEIARVPAAGPWRIRVVPNKYPAVAPSPARGSDGEGATDAADGEVATGAHEVVVLTPDHDVHPADLRPGDLADGLGALLDRVDHHGAAGRRTQAFLNVGAAAGATVPHAHAQVLALDRVPGALADSPALPPAADGWPHRRGCVVCRDLADERLHVRADGSVVSVRPLAGAIPGALLLAAREAEPPRDLRSLLDEGLADLLLDGLRRLRATGDDPACNVLLRPRAGHPHVEIVPRTTRWGGFESATGVLLVAVDPYADAARLRTVDPTPVDPPGTPEPADGARGG